MVQCIDRDCQGLEKGRFYLIGLACLHRMMIKSGNNNGVGCAAQLTHWMLLNGTLKMLKW